MGRFVGHNPKLEISGMRRFRYIPDEHNPFGFVDDDGNEILLTESFYSDGGTIPRFVWGISGLGHLDYLPAYLVHDWEFIKAREMGEKYPYTLKQVNKRLIQGIKEIDRINGKNRWIQRALIYLFCQIGGRWLWDGP